MLTTTIGLFSVSVTDIVPVTQFGYASTLGAVVAIFAGIFVTPAILTVLPLARRQAKRPTAASDSRGWGTGCCGTAGG